MTDHHQQIQHPSSSSMMSRQSAYVGDDDDGGIRTTTGDFISHSPIINNFNTTSTSSPTTPIISNDHWAEENDDDDEEEEAWDEVDVEQDNSASALAAATAAAAKPIDIVISKGSGVKKVKKKVDINVTRERMIRQERHKVHTLCQLTTGLVRNRWINDSLLKARLMSIVPLNLQNSFTSFNRSTHPNERDRSRLFDLALKDLLSWWFQSFDIDGTKGIKRRPVSEVEAALVEWQVNSSSGNSSGTWPWEEQENLSRASLKEKGKRRGDGGAGGDSSTLTNNGSSHRRYSKDTQTFLDHFGCEVIHSQKSLMRHALTMTGSKDISAQLFTSLCRAMDIPSRLIFSLQAVDWRAPSMTTKATSRRLYGRRNGNETTDSEAGFTTGGSKGSAPRSVTQVIQGRGGRGGKRSQKASGASTDDSDDYHSRFNYKPPPVNLRKTKLAKRIGLTGVRSGTPQASELEAPPVFWVEVWSRYQRQWISVDPVRKLLRCRAVMEPVRVDPNNQLLYVVAFEEDGTVRDVSPRYAKSYHNITVKARVPSRKGTDWFRDLLQPFKRDFLLNRDREEDQELWARTANEPMPSSVAGFKNHPNYVLEQHLHRDEVIRPGVKRVGVFRGTEDVYARAAVVSLKSVENYYREGRVVKDNEIPMKWVKQRTVTINRRRLEEARKYDGEDPMQQPLYAEEQTELYTPPPVNNGKVPRNNFGNIDLFVPSMLPQGAIHIPNKSAAKVAKLLGLDYAEAIIGFEFRQRRAIPLMAGVVVAEDLADTLLGAIITSEDAAEEKEFAKRQDRCLKRWKKLITGLRIRQRIQASYRTQPSASESMLEEEERSEFNRGVKRPKREEDVVESNGKKSVRLKVDPSLEDKNDKSLSSRKAGFQKMSDTTESRKAVFAESEKPSPPSTRTLPMRSARLASRQDRTLHSPAGATRSSLRNAHLKTQSQPVEYQKLSTSGRTLRLSLSSDAERSKATSSASDSEQSESSLELESD